MASQSGRDSKIQIVSTRCRRIFKKYDQCQKQGNVKKVSSSKTS